MLHFLVFIETGSRYVALDVLELIRDLPASASWCWYQRLAPPCPVSSFFGDCSGFIFNAIHQSCSLCFQSWREVVCFLTVASFPYHGLQGPWMSQPFPTVFLFFDSCFWVLGAVLQPLILQFSMLLVLVFNFLIWTSPFFFTLLFSFICSSVIILAFIIASWNYKILTLQY